MGDCKAMSLDQTLANIRLKASKDTIFGIVFSDKLLSFEELASKGRTAWELTMQYIRSGLWSHNDPYRIEQIYYYNYVWNLINQKIRDGEYIK